MIKNKHQRFDEERMKWQNCVDEVQGKNFELLKAKSDPVLIDNYKCGIDESLSMNIIELTLKKIQQLFWNS